jgi:hypothetical protein
MASKPLTAAVLELHSVVEIRIKPKGEVWYGVAEAQGDDQLRVKLCPIDPEGYPVWEEGTPVQCIMEGADGRYHSEAIVLKQSNDLVWFHLPPLSTRIDRRKSLRVTGGMPVTYRTDDEDGIAVCLDVGASGMRLRMPTEMPERTQLELYFILPGETLPIRTKGIVTHVSRPENSSAKVDVGVKFVGPNPADVARLVRFSRM